MCTRRVVLLVPCLLLLALAGCSLRSDVGTSTPGSTPAARATPSSSRLMATGRNLHGEIMVRMLTSGGYHLAGVAAGSPADLQGLLWMLVRRGCAEATDPNRPGEPGTTLARGYPPISALVRRDDLAPTYALVAFPDGGGPIRFCSEVDPRAAAASPRTSAGRYADPPETCPVTPPPEPRFIPPPGFSYVTPEPAAGRFWYGTELLWTQLDRSGAWAGLPVDDRGAIVQKMFWWRGERGQLTVTGHRLAGGGTVKLLSSSAPDGYGDLGWQVVGLEIPVAGCWRITGELNGVFLSFVVWVAP